MVKTCRVCRCDYKAPYREWYDNLVPTVCSGACYLDWLESVAKEHELIPGNLFPVALTNKSRRSEYERRFEEWLIENKVSFSYEPYSFNLSKRIYVPDYLINIGTFAEVKGLWNSGDKTKIRDFLKTGRHIHVIDEPFLRGLRYERGGQKRSVQHRPG